MIFIFLTHSSFSQFGLWNDGYFIIVSLTLENLIKLDQIRAAHFVAGVISQYFHRLVIVVGSVVNLAWRVFGKKFRILYWIFYKSQCDLRSIYIIYTLNTSFLLYFCFFKKQISNINWPHTQTFTLEQSQIISF